LHVLDDIVETKADFDWFGGTPCGGGISRGHLGLLGPVRVRVRVRVVREEVVMVVGGGGDEWSKGGDGGGGGGEVLGRNQQPSYYFYYYNYLVRLPQR